MDMSTRFYHPSWKVYYHEVLETMPMIGYSESQRMLSDWIKNAGAYKDERKFCSPCYKAYSVLSKVKKVKTGSGRCPSSCPVRCPNHLQRQIEFPS